MTSYKDIDAAFRETFLLEDPFVLPVILATVLSHYTKGDPIWLMLIAEAGSGKTELLSSLEAIPQVHPLDTISPKTFLSGYERSDKGETSLLKRLGSPIFTVEDFSTVLSERLHDQRNIMGQLRKIYDGRYAKDVGTEKESIAWRGKVTLIVGCTTAIDSNQGGMATQELGERFLDYRYHISNPLATTEAALNQNGNEAETRYRRMQLVGKFMDGFDFKMAFPQSQGPKLPKEILKRLPPLADFAARCRSTVPREPYTHEMVRLPQRETGTRLVKQLGRLGESLMLVDPLLDIWPILYKVAMDSLPPLRLAILRILSSPLTTSTISNRLHLPKGSMMRALQDLDALNIVKSEGTEIGGYTWSRLLWQ